MKTYIKEYGHIKIICYDPEPHRTHFTNNHKIKAGFEVYLKSLKKNKGEYRKVFSMNLPREALKRIGVAMAKNDEKLEKNETCLLEVKP